MVKMPVPVKLLCFAIISCIIVSVVYFTNSAVLSATLDCYDSFYLYLFITIAIMTLFFAYISSRSFLFRIISLFIVFLPSVIALYIAIKFGASINSVFLSNVMLTTWQEATPFLTYQVFLFSAAFLFTLVSLSSLLGKMRVDLFPLSNKKFRIAANVIFAVLFLFTFHIHFYPLRFHYTAITEYYQAKKRIVGFIQKMSALEKKGEPSVFSKPVPNKTILFVHLGESVRTDHAPMNGYYRNTMPYMMKEFQKGNLYTFPKALSFAVTTQFSVIGVMTPTAIADNTIRSCSFMKVAKDMGIETSAFFSSLTFDLITKHDMAINIYTANIGHRYSVLGMAHTLLPQIKSAIDQSGSKPQLMYYQGEGSHIPYVRYDHDKFSEFTPVNFNKDANQTTTNAYDNTIVSTDDFIEHIIEYLKDKNAVYIFASDHGEMMGDNGVWGRTGQNRMDNDKVRKVLFFIWVSEKFKKECPEKYAALQLNSKKLSAVSHEDIYHTVLGFYNIKNKRYKKELDLFTTSAKPFPGPMPEDLPRGTFFDDVKFAY